MICLPEPFGAMGLPNLAKKKGIDGIALPLSAWLAEVARTVGGPALAAFARLHCKWSRCG